MLTPPWCPRTIAFTEDNSISACMSSALQKQTSTSIRSPGGSMKTLIEGGWVVAFNGTSHELYENGSVVYENDHIVHAGGPYTGTVDTRLSARGKLVSPGFINTHVHTTGNGGDYMLHDLAKND